MSLSDFYRIRENAILPSSSQFSNVINRSPKMSTTHIESDRSTFLDKAINHKNKLIEFDKNNKHFNPLLTYEKQIDPYSLVGPEDDAIREIDKMCKCAKVATIREKQLDERIAIENIYKKKEQRLDLMMELERLKEIKFKEEKDLNTKRLNK